METGGTAGGTNPEQLFAVGYAACFENSLGVVARRRKLDLGDVAIDAKVMLLPTEDRAFKLGVERGVPLPAVDDARPRGRARPRRAPGLPVLQRHARQHRRLTHRERPRP